MGYNLSGSRVGRTNIMKVPMEVGRSIQAPSIG